MNGSFHTKLRQNNKLRNMEKLTISLFFLFVGTLDAIRLFRTTTNLKEFISNKNSNKTSYVEIQNSKLANVRLLGQTSNQYKNISGWWIYNMFKNTNLSISHSTSCDCRKSIGEAIHVWWKWNYIQVLEKLKSCK